MSTADRLAERMRVADRLAEKMRKSLRFTGAELEPDLADRLRKSLRVSGVTRDQMARFLGVTSAAIGGWLQGARPQRRDTLTLWAVKTGVPEDWLRVGVPWLPDPRELDADEARGPLELEPPPAPPTDEFAGLDLVDADEACAMLPGAHNRSTVLRWAQQGALPIFHRNPGRAVLFRRDEVRLLEQRLRGGLSIADIAALRQSS